MIRVACLLLLSAQALAAPASQPAQPGRSAELPRPPPDRAVPGSEHRPDHLLTRTLWKFKRSAPPENIDNRKRFVVKLLCRKDEQCAHAQLYEFDLLRVEPGVSGNRVYY